MHFLTTASRLMIALIILPGIAIPAFSQTVIFPFGSTWKYLDNGSNQGTAWRTTSFSDLSWKSGPGQLGYGDGDEATKVSYGGVSTNKYVTTYFRMAVTITGKANFASFKMEFKRDDGIIIYVNGTEVKRSNMPSSTVTYTTLASTAASDDGSAIQSATIATGYFAEGKNIIAAEIHQNSRTSSDISFDMRLTGNPVIVAPPVKDSINRGPYLQMTSQSAISIRWATNIADNSKVSYGTAAGSLNASLSDTTKTTEHELRITGLAPDTKYYYSVGTTTSILEGTAKNYFVTAPSSATTRKIRIAAFGDCGNNSTNQVNVRNAYLNYVGSNTTDLWLLLGDNAYNSGLATEFQTNFFNIYKDNLLKNCSLFPATGNHEYANSASLQDSHNIPYLSLFSMPKNAECGGIASGKKEYYSYDYGDIHFISLDSYGEEQNKRVYDTTSAQALWLKADLAANQRKWTIAYWHHPPYTMGSQSSDTDPELTGIRTNLIRILERYGVDLIICGHSHTYERSYLLHDHFGLENTFSFAANAYSNSSGKYDGSANSCPYITSSSKTKHGTVYVVAGSAGQLGGTQSSFPHAAMYYSNATTGGSFVIEIQGNRLDAKFVASDNTIKDQFTIFKDVDQSKALTITNGQPLTLTASWAGNYNWSTGATTQSIILNPAIAGNYYVSDNSVAANRCLMDTFSLSAVVINSSQTMDTATIKPETVDGFAFRVYPNPANGIIHLEITSSTAQNARFSISDINGRWVRTGYLFVAVGTTTQDINLRAGVYFVTVRNANGAGKTVKVISQ